MAPHAPGGDVAAILHAVSSLHDAMTAGGTGAIAALLADDYALVHITGYLQPGAEWLEVIGNRQFVYHAIAVDHATVMVDLRNDHADVSGQGVFDATINGMRAPWRLRFTMSLRQAAGYWQFTQGRYASF